MSGIPAAMDFQQALALHRQERTDEAARGYERVLAAEPAHLDALIHLGALRLGQGRADSAEALLRRAVTAAPGSPEAHGNLAAALQALGRHDAAAEHYRRTLALRPDMLDARFGLAACLHATGQHEAAIACYEVLLDADPAHPEANYALATLLAQLGRADDAVVKYRAALAADPDFAEASYGLGTLLARGGAPEQAVSCLSSALEVDPDYVEARVSLGDVLSRLHRHDEAMAAFVAVLAGDPDHAEAIAGLANAMKQLDRHAEAVALARRLVALRPDDASAAGLLGSILAELGSIDDALAQLRRAVALAPARPEFAYHVVQLARIRPGDAALLALEAALPGVASLPAQEQGLVHFGLAKAYEDIGAPERGFASLLRGNAVRRARVDYDEAAVLGAMARIPQGFTAQLLAARRDLGDPSALPVFIVGMPRSGTTLVEQILASHTEVFGGGERPELPRIIARVNAGTAGGMTGVALRRMGSDYVAALRSLAPGAARITDKLPGNFQNLGLIRLILPNARIIHLVRDPVDTCLSCFSKLFTTEQAFSYDLAELGRYHRAYRRLMVYWRSVLPADILLEVEYEALVEDVETQARRMVAHCGLAWDPACLRFHQTARPVHTASMVQVRQPIYRGSVGRWRPEAALLQPLLEALAAP